jgi:ABC-type uncharacterized transport system permease subunit
MEVGLMRKSAVTLVLGITLAWTVSASADGSQAGCQAYGEAIAGGAQSGGLGTLISSVATSESGAVAGVVVIVKQATC